MPYNQSVDKFWVISIVVHLLLWWILSSLSSTFAQNHPVPVEVVYQTPHRPKDQIQQQIVHQTDVPKDQIQDNDKKARFESEREQRVKEETRAAVIGETTINKNSGNPMQRPPQARRPQPALNLKEPLHAPGLGTPEEKNAQNENEQQKKFDDSQPLELNPGFGPSERTDELNDMKIGTMTALNTDRYLYYSFYDRLDKRVVPRWRQRVHRILDGVNSHQAGEWNTVLEVLLSPNGEYVRSVVLQSSGWDALDKAPMYAFQEGAPIPHPPPEMVKSDGYIHVVFGFSVHMRY
jgi:hypothetical protein